MSGTGRLKSLKENPLTPCLGLGIIRGVDAINKCLYILTPIAFDRLKECNILIRGSLELPTIALHVGNGSATPYLSSEAVAGEGANAQKSRNNLQRNRK